MEDAFQLMRRPSVEERLAGIFMALKVLEREETTPEDTSAAEILLKRIVDTVSPVFIMQLLYNGHGDDRRIMRHGALSLLATAISFPSIAANFEQYCGDYATIAITNATAAESEALLFILDSLFNENTSLFATALSAMLQHFDTTNASASKLTTLQQFLYSIPNTALPASDAFVLRKIIFDALPGSAPEEQRDITMRLLAALFEHAKLSWTYDEGFRFLRLITSIACNEFRLLHEECLQYISEVFLSPKQLERWQRIMHLYSTHLSVLSGIIALLSSEDDMEDSAAEESALPYDARLFIHKTLAECIEHFFTCITDACKYSDLVSDSSLERRCAYRGFITQSMQCIAHFIVHDDNTQLFVLKHLPSILHFSAIHDMTEASTLKLSEKESSVVKLLTSSHSENEIGENIDVFFAMLPCLLPLLVTPAGASDAKTLNEKPVASMLHQMQCDKAFVHEQLLQCPSLAHCSAIITIAAATTSTLTDSNLSSSVASCCECIIFYDVICSAQTNRSTLTDVLTSPVMRRLDKALALVSKAKHNDCVVEHMFDAIERVKDIIGSYNL